MEPSASNGHTINIEIRLAAVIEATAMEPKPFTAVCSMTLPIAVIEY